MQRPLAECSVFRYNDSMKANTTNEALLAAAREAVSAAYDGERHTVGAAILCGSGAIYAGVNVWSLHGACAEQVAQVPTQPGTSLYIRPFVIATDPFLGVRPSDTYLFLIILSPSGAYYESGLDPVKIWIEDTYVRAVRGGIGEAKTGGNYVASLAAQMKAHDEGYSQVLWLDGVERKYIEEVGAMNIFFKINGKVVTPKLNGSILPGVTRASCIDLCKHWGMEVEERRISVDELVEAARTGALEECWGSGTAAVISPVGTLRYEDEVMEIGGGGIGPVSQKLYDTVTGIQTGKVNDEFGWTVEVQ